MAYEDRRKYPRVSESVQCRLALGPDRFETQTKDISCGGALCQLSGLVPVMTKMEVVLDIPPPHGLGEVARDSIRCEGVVVRQDRLPLSERPAYLTAIYFSDLKPEDRRRLAEFILRSMMERDRRRS